MGDFGKIMNVAKRMKKFTFVSTGPKKLNGKNIGAKRIGLLFSEAQIDLRLDPTYITDISDLRSGDELFSDGCGLISARLAVQLSKSKRIIFRHVRYTPCVFLIRCVHFDAGLNRA